MMVAIIITTMLMLLVMAFQLLKYQSRHTLLVVASVIIPVITAMVGDGDDSDDKSMQRSLFNI